ncbi:ubiquitin-protein ligase E3 RBBP6 family protein [Schizosaccharomyces cryophilus OY26]|uniref:Ubiquitin-protein ligase E3 RBBP6 family protein n=1 Tax=Schizosaccharomyces cryophilus (strain OY26 / ATCC MYA-4695 / CBS 11777 / NBRC 106824 / NRRL Y48691) TaxID=653667 RepID=S9W588_SCHCR|nr:ubiquitin-protein ligase E3 RBBP6 family protein [Schizosaccharomyces cryophilus OY26]EPY53719.1 ubiquitin-protein ligase E3 RBBP6 family protein [Schizosaccharomyces cryophilus OY26]
MSGVIYYKFKSQKDPSRVSFDGTVGMSVFDVKREIIQQKKLGSGLDFDLLLYNANTNEEYDDDTYIIPRSTSVIVRRVPAQKSGKGTAARYVSGAPRTTGNTRPELAKKPVPMLQKKPQTNTATSGDPSATKLAPGTSEEAAIQQMFQVSSDQWRETQDKMASATPIYKPNQRRIAASIPDKPPPPGYICYRCGLKGHWIQACPTNADPNYDGKPRVKRTTGIPRSFLKSIDAPAEGDTANIMINAEGEYVVAQPDQASWESYQARKVALTANDVYKMQPPDSSLACTICKKLAKNAFRTPCCDQLFCEDCIQTALLDTDFECPHCHQKDVLLDSLKADYQVQRKIESVVRSVLATHNKESQESIPSLDSSSSSLNEKRKREDDEVSNPSKYSAKSSANYAKPSAQPAFRPGMPVPSGMPMPPGMPPLPHLQGFPAPFPPFMMPGFPQMPMMKNNEMSNLPYGPQSRPNYKPPSRSSHSPTPTTSAVQNNSSPNIT